MQQKLSWIEREVLWASLTSSFGSIHHKHRRKKEGGKKKKKKKKKKIKNLQKVYLT